MLRRNLLQLSLAATWGVLADGPEAVYADDVIVWGAPSDSLAVGLCLRPSKVPTDLAVLFKNLGSDPKDLYLLDGVIDRVTFRATGRDAKEYMLNDRKMYRPCAGLCDSPAAFKRVNAGGTFGVTFSLDDLLYVPPKDPYTTLAVLLPQRCSVQAFFEVTDKQLKDAKLHSDLAWIGRAISGQVRQF